MKVAGSENKNIYGNNEANGDENANDKHTMATS